VHIVIIVIIAKVGLEKTLWAHNGVWTEASPYRKNKDYAFAGTVLVVFLPQGLYFRGYGYGMV
jgi:hypothetical protein